MQISVNFELVVSVIALFVAVATTWFQIRHNMLSFRPLPDVSVIRKTIKMGEEIYYQYEIILLNIGNGPMRVTEFSVIDRDGEILFKDSFKNYQKIQGLPLGFCSYWNFRNSSESRFQVGTNLPIFVLKHEIYEDLIYYVGDLHECKIRLKYKDFYNVTRSEDLEIPDVV